MATSFRNFRAGVFLALAPTIGLILEATDPVAAGSVLYHEDFGRADPMTGLPRGWNKGPPAHVTYFTTARDSELFGRQSPSLRVDLPPQTLNYRVASAWIAVPSLDATHTLELTIRVDQPDSPFLVEAIFYDRQHQWIEERVLMDLPGSSMTQFETYRVSFDGVGRAEPGFISIFFGLSYVKAYRAGSFWVDDLELREGAETGALDFYLRPRCVKPGSEVEVHLSCAEGSASMQVLREADQSVVMDGPRALDGLGSEPIPEESWRNGCRWPVSTRIATDAAWQSGLYTVRVRDRNREVRSYFVVGPGRIPARVLVLLPTHTEAAYNGWGGGSFYSQSQSTEVSFERPISGSGQGPYASSIHLVRWLSREGIAFDVATDDELHDTPEMLLRYRGVIIPGHSEYWSRSMRRGVEDYLAAGGSLICLSGNTCWWQTRVEDNAEGRRLVCYKYRAPSDPMWSVDSSQVTTRWDEAPLRDPPTRFLGLSWRHGGMVNWLPSSLCPCPYDWLLGHGGYEAFNTDHWAFEGTGVLEGETIGRRFACVGYEVDGAPIEWKDGRPAVLLQGGTPEGFRILGHAPCWSQFGVDSTGVALMGLYENGSSFVFNGGSIGWCFGLAGDPVIQRITRNLIDHLADGIPAGPAKSHLRIVPNPMRSTTRLEAVGRPLSRWMQIRSIDGRRIARLPVQQIWIDKVAASWDGRDDLGEPVPSGVYWVEAERHGRGRLVRVR